MRASAGGAAQRGDGGGDGKCAGESVGRAAEDHGGLLFEASAVSPS